MPDMVAWINEHFYRDLPSAVDHVVFRDEILEVLRPEHSVLDLGAGRSSSLGIHVGQEEGAKAFIQQSTGTVMETDIDPALNIKSGLINWREK